MKYIISLFRKICHASVACILLVAFFVSADLFSAQAAEGVTFSWGANPVEDDVVGYRLYYGLESRFTHGQYERYIDFTSWQSCPADTKGYGCDPLAANAVSCEDLFRENPKCTVNSLSNGLYFAMTAYNGLAESGYTRELYSNANSDSPQNFAFLPAVYNLLLL